MDHLGDNGRISADIIGKDRTGFLVSLDFTCFPGTGFVGFTRGARKRTFRTGSPNTNVSMLYAYFM